jgi:hypothetical protein
LRQPERAATHGPAFQVQLRTSSPFDELVVQRLLLRRGDLPQRREQLPAFGNMLFHDFRLCQQPRTQAGIQREIRAPAEKRADDI